jgi:hypothetical protein
VIRHHPAFLPPGVNGGGSVRKPSAQESVCKWGSQIVLYLRMARRRSPPVRGSDGSGSACGLYSLTPCRWWCSGPGETASTQLFNHQNPRFRDVDLAGRYAAESSTTTYMQQPAALRGGPLTGDSSGLCGQPGENSQSTFASNAGPLWFLDPHGQVLQASSPGWARKRIGNPFRMVGR